MEKEIPPKSWKGLLGEKKEIREIHLLRRKVDGGLIHRKKNRIGAGLWGQMRKKRVKVTQLH